MLENLLSLTLKQIQAATASKSLSCESGTEAFKHASKTSRPVSFESRTLHKDETFTIPSTTSDAWVASPLRADGPVHCRALVLIKSPLSGSQRGFELYLGTLTKSVRDKDGKSVSAQIKDLNGNEISFETCVTQADCWKVLENRTFKVSVVHEVPITRTNRDTGAQWSTTTFVYEFQEVNS